MISIDGGKALVRVAAVAWLAAILLCGASAVGQLDDAAAKYKGAAPD